MKERKGKLLAMLTAGLVKLSLLCASEKYTRETLPMEGLVYPWMLTGKWSRSVMLTYAARLRFVGGRECFVERKSCCLGDLKSAIG